MINTLRSESKVDLIAKKLSVQYSHRILEKRKGPKRALSPKQQSNQT
tara:strand:+ start:382 stop:522 length:141 start_codon:yes stop_codon:yes gene_type:complete